MQKIVCNTQYDCKRLPKNTFAFLIWLLRVQPRQQLELGAYKKNNNHTTFNFCGALQSSLPFEAMTYELVVGLVI